jgi:hypothetical protein
MTVELMADPPFDVTVVSIVTRKGRFCWVKERRVVQLLIAGERCGSPDQEALQLKRQVLISDFFGGLGDDRRGGLKTDLGMGSVAEWLVDRCSAATERDGGLAGKIQ